MADLKTDQYILNYFKRGSLYSGTADYRRFVTLDYNLDSYVGITGVGIISGWTVEHVNGLQIKILPGKGIIQDYAMESPYVYKTRSAMVIPEREVEVVNTDPDETPPANLSTSERAAYIAVIQDYDPTYNPSGPIPNENVKVVTPSTLTLANNNDNYIYARRATLEKPYPALTDLKTLIDGLGDEPKESDYDTTAEYDAALAIYNAKLATIYSYDFRDSSANQFTDVLFESSTRQMASSSYLLLAKVVTRNGTVSSIDTSMVNNLDNLRSKIQSLAKEVLQSHKHGGSGRYDPAKIKLETDTRDTTLTAYSQENQVGTYKVLSSNKTSVTESHKHTYYVDEDGDGYTVGIVGTDINHFHKISSFTVQANEYSEGEIKSHSHTIPSTEYSEWTSDSLFNVYIDGEFFGDQSSSSVTSYPSKSEILIEQGVPRVYRAFYSTFNFSIFSTNAQGESVITQYTYEYTYRASSVFEFMLRMQIDFQNQHGSKFDIDNISSHPFLFQNSDNTSWIGLDPLKEQSSIAESLLRKVDDQFTFTPNAAKNVTITVVEVSTLSGDSGVNVTLEILGNSEVDGILSSDNILFLNAEKVVLGEFDPERIPFLDHIGRIEEKCIPFRQNIISENGTKYSVVPSTTGVNLEHSHDVFVNTEGDGATQMVFIGEDPVYYAANSSGGTDYLIAHIHGINNNNISDSDSEGFILWQNDLNNANANSYSHVHEINFPYVGDPKTIYSIQEDKYGNIFAGTSSGAYVIPNDECYLYVINGERFYLIGNDLWDLLLDAKKLYEDRTDIPLTITSNVYSSQLTLAEEELEDDGDSYMVYGTTGASFGRDEIMIKKLSSFELPNFKYVSEKAPYEVKEGEIITGVKYYWLSDGTEVVDLDELESSDADDIIQINTVERYFNDVPIWSMEIRDDYSTNAEGEPNGDVSGVAIEDIFVLGPNILSRGRDISLNFYKDWVAPNIPQHAGGLRKVIKDNSNNLWVPTSRGLFVSRSVQNGRILEEVTTPGFTQDIKDIVESKDDELMIVSESGIFKTIDGGKNWTTVLAVSGGFKQILRDYSGGAYTNILYAVSNDRYIYRSLDNGANWTKFGTILTGETSDLFAFNEFLFISKNDGLYMRSGEYWSRVLEEVVYSFKPSYDFQSMYVGTNGSIYSTSNGSDYSLVHKFVGQPLALYYEESTPQYYGYAYNKNSNAFYFKDFKYVTEDISTSVIVDCNKWIALNGHWDENVEYEIFVDNKLVFSKESGIDKRGVSVDNFIVNPSEGSINFGAMSSLQSPTEINDASVYVSNSYGFSIGDRIVVQSTVSPPELPSVPASIGEMESYVENIQDYSERIEEVRDMVFYSQVASIVGNFIILNEKIDKEIELPAYARKISNLNGATDVNINIYDSPLINKGKYTHREIEDKLSTHSDTRPYLLNNTYLSNLLQLTQAMRYVYPDIDSEFKQSKFYDFHYDWSDGQPNPNITDYIDVSESDIYNQVLYNSSFTRIFAKSVNKILVGYGSFQNYLIAATDIGLFWSKIADGFEGNWFYVNSFRTSVYDIKILNDDTIYAATSNGIYYSQDMSTWTLESSPSIYFPVKRLELRWKGGDTISIPSHTAEFENDDYSSPTEGYITSASSLYGLIEQSRNIKISGTTSLDGEYNVKDVTPTRITIEGGFTSLTSSVIENAVEIKMELWWKQFDGEDFTGTAAITNTLLAGGSDRISYKIGEGIWNESSFGEELLKFEVSDFLCLSNGNMLASAIGKYYTYQENYIFSSSDVGSNWSVIKKLEEVQGEIISSKPTSFGNTELTVSYIVPEEYTYKNGILNLQQIAIYAGNSSQSLAQGYVIWNNFEDEKHKIYVFEQDFHDIVQDNQDAYLIFKVLPVSVKSITELSDKSILFGTSTGIYSDGKTTVGYNQTMGEIGRIGTTGYVNSIDINGKIKYVSSNSVNGNVKLSIYTESSVSGSELVSSTLHITDLDPIASFDIVANSGKSSNGETIVEISTPYNDQWINYKEKAVVISPPQSVINVTFDYDIGAKSFAGGTLYIVSDENNNVGNSYQIIRNTRGSITVNQSIVPPTTFYGGDISGNTELIAGQKICLVDSTGRLVLYVNFDNEVFENQFAGSNFVLIGTSTTTEEEDEELNFTIHSHTKNSITIDSFASSVAIPLEFSILDRFAIRGRSFEKVEGFNAQKTSTNTGHYHTVNLVKNLVKGDVGSVSTGDLGTDVTVNNMTGWNSSILDSDSTLLAGAKVTLYNPNFYGVSYETKVVTATSTTIKVETVNTALWDSSGYNSKKISAGWKIEVDSRFYGYTSGTIYDDFIVDIQSVTENLTSNTNEIKVVDTSNMVIGDKIQIVDGFGTNEIHYIATIDDAETFTTVTSLNSTFFASQNARVKVLRDDFSNTHTHRIKRNEIEKLLVEDYNNKGYSSRHSHRCLPYLESVNDIATLSDKILAIGSNSKIYKGNLEGTIWTEYTDLNNCLEIGEEIEGVSSLALSSGNVIVGTTNGYMFSNLSGSNVVGLEKPTV